MKIRPIKMSDEQWEIVKVLSSKTGQSASDWVRDACAAKASAQQVFFPPSAQHGGLREKRK